MSISATNEVHIINLDIDDQTSEEQAIQLPIGPKIKSNSNQIYIPTNVQTLNDLSQDPLKLLLEPNDSTACIPQNFGSTVSLYTPNKTFDDYSVSYDISDIASFQFPIFNQHPVRQSIIEKYSLLAPCLLTLSQRQEKEEEQQRQNELSQSAKKQQHITKKSQDLEGKESSEQLENKGQLQEEDEQEQNSKQSGSLTAVGFDRSSEFGDKINIFPKSLQHFSTVMTSFFDLACSLEGIEHEPLSKTAQLSGSTQYITPIKHEKCDKKKLTKSITDDEMNPAKLNEFLKMINTLSQEIGQLDWEDANISRILNWMNNRPLLKQMIKSSESGLQRALLPSELRQFVTTLTETDCTESEDYPTLTGYLLPPDLKQLLLVDRQLVLQFHYFSKQLLTKKQETFSSSAASSSSSSQSSSSESTSLTTTTTTTTTTSQGEQSLDINQITTSELLSQIIDLSYPFNQSMISILLNYITYNVNTDTSLEGFIGIVQFCHLLCTLFDNIFETHLLYTEECHSYVIFKAYFYYYIKSHFSESVIEKETYVDLLSDSIKSLPESLQTGTLGLWGQRYSQFLQNNSISSSSGHFLQRNSSKSFGSQRHTDSDDNSDSDGTDDDNISDSDSDNDSKNTPNKRKNKSGTKGGKKLPPPKKQKTSVINNNTIKDATVADTIKPKTSKVIQLDNITVQFHPCEHYGLFHMLRLLYYIPQLDLTKHLDQEQQHQLSYKLSDFTQWLIQQTHLLVRATLNKEEQYAKLRILSQCYGVDINSTPRDLQQEYSLNNLFLTTNSSDNSNITTTTTSTTTSITTTTTTTTNNNNSQVTSNLEHILDSDNSQSLQFFHTVDPTIDFFVDSVPIGSNHSVYSQLNKYCEELQQMTYFGHTSGLSDELNVINQEITPCYSDRRKIANDYIATQMPVMSLLSGTIVSALPQNHILQDQDNTKTIVKTPTKRKSIAN